MIPRVIHQIWLGGEVPDPLARFCAGWRELHPEWEWRLWTSPDELELRNADLLRQPEVFVPAGSVPQFVADVMRYEILERFGGLYVDTDMECRKPLDGLVAGAECFAAWESQGSWIGNAILGSVPGALFMQRLIDALPWSADRHRHKRPNVSSGPQFLTQQYRGHERELTVFEQAMFYPASWSEFRRSTEAFPDAYTVHHWNNQRKKVGVPF